MLMKNSKFCCNNPVDRATNIVAIVEMVLGALEFTSLMLSLYSPSIYDDAENQITHNQSPRLLWMSTHRRLEERRASAETRYEWFIVTSLVCSGIQTVMGIFLCISVKMKNPKMVLTWLITTVLTSIFTFFLVRVYMILVVYEYYRELQIERRMHDIAESGGHDNPLPVVDENAKPQHETLQPESENPPLEHKYSPSKNENPPPQH